MAARTSEPASSPISTQVGLDLLGRSPSASGTFKGTGPDPQDELGCLLPIQELGLTLTEYFPGVGLGHRDVRVGGTVRGLHVSPL